MGTLILCMNCNTLLESRSRHDFQQCDCENKTFVDGGEDYCRIGGKDLNLIRIIDGDKDPK